MSDSPRATLEQRLTLLEQEVARLKEQAARNGGNGRAGAVDWIERITGSMKDFPEFEQVLELGRSIRRADAPESSPCADDGNGPAQ